VVNLDLKYMVGTEGRPDYIVIAEVGDYTLGIKAIIVPMDDAPEWFVGFRLRAVPTDPLVPGLEAGFSEAWPLINWANINETRASVMVGGPLPVPSIAVLPRILLGTEFVEVAAEEVLAVVETDTLTIAEGDFDSVLRTSLRGALADLIPENQNKLQNAGVQNFFTDLTPPPFDKIH
jgi:hypothetical protein